MISPVIAAVDRKPTDPDILWVIVTADCFYSSCFVFSSIKEI